MDAQEQKRLFKEAAKEAIKEWLDEKIATFGWFAVKTIAAAVLAALTYFILTMNGWKHG